MMDALHIVKAAYGSYDYFIIFLLCALLGLVLCKGKRRILFIPALLVAAVVVNPVFMRLWEKVDDGGKVFWRMLWMIPVISVMAALPAAITDQNRRMPVKLASIAAAIAIFVLMGSMIYDNPQTAFVRVDNPDKLSDDVVRVGEALLALEEEPRVVADPELSPYLRQFSGKIHSAFARDVVYGGASNELAETLYNRLTEGDMAAVCQTMLNYDYDYLVIPDNGRMYHVRKAGFEPVKRVGGYGIYRATGARTELRTYNALHQVVSVTSVDAEGRLVNGPGGYATKSFEYDRYGRMNREFRTDIDGNPVADGAGSAGFCRVISRKGWLLETTWLGPDGAPVNRKDVNFATLKTDYDRSGKTLYETYYDADGARIAHKDGYYAQKREFEGNREVGGTFLDAEGQPANYFVSGYASYRCEYDEAGEPWLTYYYDADGAPVECGSGYFHDFFQSLKGKTFIISVRDEASGGMTPKLVEDMHALGIQTDLIGKYRSAFYAIVTPGGVIEDCGAEALSYHGTLDGMEISVLSAGFDAGNDSSIMIDGVEYSINLRGMNIVVLDGGNVVDSLAIDTCTQEMHVTR